MSTFIDRNPEQMMKYAREAKTVVGDMVLLIRKVEGLLDAYEKDLDTPTQKQIKTLHECCDAYLKQIDVYQNVADDVEKKGKGLSLVRNGG